MSDENRQAHRSSAWEPPVEGLLPTRTRALLCAAVTAAAPIGEAERFLSVLHALLPPIEMYRDILGDAWETLAGDGDTRRRFTERLRSLPRPGGTSPAVDDRATDWDADGLLELRDRLVARRRAAPRSVTVVPADAAALLIMAAVHAGCGDEASIHDNVSTVLAQLAAYDRLRPLLVEATAALRGDERGTHALRRSLERLESVIACEPDPACAVRSPTDLVRGAAPADDASLDHWIVTAEALSAWREFVWTSPMYAGWDFLDLISVKPSSACAGDVIVITGKGFGTSLGKVRFHVPPGKGQNDILAIGATSYWDVTPKSWTDTQVTVTVPLSASCGNFTLRVPTGTVTVSGKTVQTYKDIGPLRIGGTLPEILDLRADGVVDRLVTPSKTVDLTWYACPDDAQVTLDVDVDGSHLWTKAGLVSSGSETLVVGGAKTTTYTAKLSVTTVCGTVTKTVTIVVHKSAKVYLSGLEITQATQFYPAGTTLPKTANTVPLIAGKQTLVRAYLGTTQEWGFNQSQVAGANVELRGWFEGGGGLYELPGSPLQPINGGSLTATNSERRDLNETANFLIPAEWMVPGPTLKLQARVWLAWDSLDSVDMKNQYATLTGVRFHAAKPLDVVVVLVNHTGPCSPGIPNCNGTPTMADAINTLYMVRRIYPADKLRIWLPEAGDQVLDFARDKGCGKCGSYSCLIYDLEDIAKGYDNDDDKIWWGALKKEVGGPGGCGAQGSNALGFAVSRVGTSAEGAAWQEFGHAFGRIHTFDDTAYPSYGYSNPDSIGEYGIDVEHLTPFQAATVNSHVYDPFLSSDFMSYKDAPIWVSPYTYMGLMQAFFAPWASGGSVVTSVPGARLRRDREERLVICGTLWTETGEVKLRPLYHLSLYPKDWRPQSSRYSLALVDRDGHTLIEEALRVRDDHTIGAHGCAHPAKLRISQSIAFDREAAAFEVRDQGEVLAHVERPSRGPAVSDVALDRGNSRWMVRWNSSHPAGLKLYHGVALTYDDGRTWQRLRADVRRSSLQFDPKGLAGGDSCRFRVVVSDGFNTTFADSETFSMPVKPPVVVLLDPDDRAEVVTGRPVHLQVEAISPRFGSLEGEAIRWESDRQGALGVGRELWVELVEGRHRIAVTAESGPESVRTLKFQVVARANETHNDGRAVPPS